MEGRVVDSYSYIPKCDVAFHEMRFESLAGNIFVVISSNLVMCYFSNNFGHLNGISFTIATDPNELLC